MDNKANMISLETELLSFDRYFEANSRCILSAPFGEGKSCFLHEFIKMKQDEYDFITLYPINYQICDNKDILEYIKRDILLALLALSPEFLTGLDKAGAEMIWKSIADCKEDVISCLPEINVGISGLASVSFSSSNIANVVSKVWEKYSKRKIFRGNPLREYFNRHEDAAGGIYEFNPISNLISSLIAERKKRLGPDDSRKVVLVIEDLDRVDPGQIFRILNMFSAHLVDNIDEAFSRNKFGFDKILLLCDYKNIKNIYSHLYGADADFNGYISKFTPNNVYHYSLRRKLEAYLETLFDKELCEKHLPIIRILIKKILSVSWDGSKLHNNIRVIKSKIKAGLESVTDDRVLVNERHNLYTRKTRMPLNKILSVAKEFDINIVQLIMDEVGRTFLNFNEVIKLCWPYVAQTRNDRIMGYPTVDNTQMYRFGISDDLLWEQKGDEIVSVSFPRSSILVPIVKAEESIFAYMKEQSKQFGLN